MKLFAWENSDALTGSTGSGDEGCEDEWLPGV